MSNQRAHYNAGDKQCEICGKDLPEFTCWHGRTHFYCDTPECRQGHTKLVRFIEIGPNEKPCVGPGCSNFAPAGRYDTRQKHFTCSRSCRSRFLNDRHAPLVECSYCGKELHRYTKRPGQLFFDSTKCSNKFRGERVTKERAGKFLPILQEYIDTYVRTHYRNEYGARNALSYFFLFLNEEGIENLDQVSAKVVSRFIAWEAARSSNPGQYLSYIGTFFDWMLSEDRRLRPNPVVNRIHRARRAKRLPRPYPEEEVTEIWRLLDMRGNNRIRLAIAIAEETGLRVGEICRLRVGDVDLRKQTVFVGTPNKTMTERRSIFSIKTLKYFDAWMAERNPDCGHDFLLHNSRGDRCTPNALQLECRRILCIWERQNKIKANDVGLKTFSFHKFRHLMASRLVNGGADAAAIMAQGGWKSFSAMCGYTELDPEHALRSFNEATERGLRSRQENCPKKRVSGFQKYRQPNQQSA